MQMQKLTFHKSSLTSKPPAPLVNKFKPSKENVLWCLIAFMPVGVGILLVILGEYYHKDWLIQAGVQSLLLWVGIYAQLCLSKIAETQGKSNYKRRRR